MPRAGEASKYKSPETITLGKRLREMRDAAKLTQPALAERIGASVSTVSALELGAFRVRLSTLQKYAEACGFKAELGFVPASDNP